MNDYSGIALFISCTTACNLAAKFIQAARKPPVVLMQQSSRNEKLLQSCPSLFNFSPSALYACDYYGQLQTVCQTVLRDTARIFSKICYRRELLTLSDGGTVGLDWVHSYKGEICVYKPTSPTVIIMHGLCGDSNAEYLVHLVEVLTSRKYRVVVMVARGCGGLTLSTPVPFNGARSMDFKEAVDLVHSRYPRSTLFAMGFSLGACLTMHYMSDYNDTTPIAGAIAVSPPWNFHERYTWAFELIWTRLLCFLLKQYVLKHQSSFTDIFWKIMLGTWSIKSFDSVMCKKSGYSCVDEYYSACSVTGTMHKISKPTLAISSVDDPLCNVKGCPTECTRYGSGLIAIIVEHGGHLGFAEHIFPLNSSWIDRVSVEWFEAIQSQLRD